MNQDSNRIAALVVTYNRISLLKDTVNAIRKQTRKPDAIIIVNNSSTDGTLDWLSEQNDIILINQENIGSSGGQHTGMKYAYEQGFDWIWTMDDDVYPTPNCLESLLEESDINIIRVPIRYSPDGLPVCTEAVKYNLKNPFKSFWSQIIRFEDYQEKGWVKISGASFEGPLIHRKVIERIGFPNTRFFIFADDTDFCLRAINAGFEIRIYFSSVMNRQLPARDHWEKRDWKNFYKLRNIILLDMWYGRTWGVRNIRPFLTFLKQILRFMNFSDIRTSIHAYYSANLFELTHNEYKNKLSKN